MTTPHLMIDLETLSTTPNAIVLQLGWALFDPREDGVIGSGCWHLDPGPQIARGLDVDWSTIVWWLKQSDAARTALTDREGQRLLPSEAVDKLTMLCQEYNIEGVWSHGAAFDVVIVENLYRRLLRQPPWSFRAIRDTRTLFWQAGPSLEWTVNPVQHSAEHDSIAQAIAVQRALRLIAGKPQIIEVKS